MVATATMSHLASAGGALAVNSFDHFSLAPEAPPNRKLLLQVTLNGLDFGTQLVEQSGSVISLPPETLKAIHVHAPSGETLRLEANGGTRIKLDAAASTLALDIPPSMFDLQRFAPTPPVTPSVLSRKNWGAFLNYDLNVRHALAGQSSSGQSSSDQSSSGRSNGTDLCGIKDLRVLRPDLLGGFDYHRNQKSPPERAGNSASQRMVLSASYQADHYPTTATVGVASLSLNYTVGNLPLFLNAFHSLGGWRSTTIVAGVSFQFGAVQGSVSGGAGFGGGRPGDQGWNGSVTAAQPLREETGSVGWGVLGARSPTDMVGTADAEYRSGYCIPGVGV